MALFSYIISTYPPNELADKLQYYDTLHIYVDVKNILVSLYVSEVCEKMLMNGERYGSVDSSIFQAMLSYCSFWKRYAQNNNMKCRIFFTNDNGRSEYHLNHHKGYKANRQITNLVGLNVLNDDRVKQVRDSNLRVCENTLNRLPNIYFFTLKFIESDFLSHYLIKRKFNDDNIFHIICSSDKDMYQTLNQNNIVQINKKRQVRNILDQKSFMAEYVHLNKAQSNKNYESLCEMVQLTNTSFFPIILAMVGDAADGVEGIHRFGSKTALKLFSNESLVDQMFGTVDETIERVIKTDRVFKCQLSDIDPVIVKKNKYIEKCFENESLIHRNVFLVSYEALIDWLLKGDNTEKNDNVKYIDRVLHKDGINVVSDVNVLYNSLCGIVDNQLSMADIEFSLL